MHSFRLPVKSVVKKYAYLFTKLNCSIPIRTSNVVCELSTLERVNNLRQFVYSCSRTSGSGQVSCSSFVSTYPNENNLGCNNFNNICSIHSKEDYRYHQKTSHENLTKSTTNTSQKQYLLETQGWQLEDKGTLVTYGTDNKVCIQPNPFQHHRENLKVPINFVDQNFTEGDKTFRDTSALISKSSKTTIPKNSQTLIKFLITSRTLLGNKKIGNKSVIATQYREMASASSSSSGNKLKEERSPYLLQHATNPVDWYPWGEEAFKAAKEKNKMIFLSVGYSTCHWCHVMERESFESNEVAAIMNEHFINVKVDREERPDVDKVYMSFIQATSGGGGWPMSVFLTPSLKPVFGGTYFPPDDQMFGRPGFKSVLTSLAKQWEAKHEAMSESGDKILEALGSQTRAVSGSSTDSLPDPEATIKKCFGQLMKGYDPVMGGFNKAPKFPQPVNFSFLFRYYAVAGNNDAKKMALHTLEMMSKGGIYDHVSDGFARYSTDENWHVPHFEKMLYDQAQLCVAYSQAYQATKDDKYRKVIDGILKYVSRDLRHSKGGFFSAEDADSLPNFSSKHKLEGAFCVWTMEELKTLLDADKDESDINGHKRSELFSTYFNAKGGGNVNPRGDPHGELKNQNVLTLIGTDKNKVMQTFGLDSNELGAHINRCIEILHNARKSRPRPHLDDKILTAWNGLMISGLCAAGNALANKEYIELAIKAATFLQENMWNTESKRLYRSAYNGKDGEVHQLNPPINGFVDDYAFLIRGLLDLYEATFEVKWLEWAAKLQQRQDELFWDNELKGYFTSAEGDSSIVLRLKEDQDGAEPASNSVTSLNLIRLSVFLDKPEFKEKAKQTMIAFKETLTRFPVALPEMTSALLTLHHTPVEIIITGDPTKCERTKELINAVHSTLLPQKVLILADGNKDNILYKNLSVLKDISVDDSGKAFVCKNYACSAPVSTPEELLKLVSNT